MSLKDKYKVVSINKSQTYEWLLKKHYAKRIPSIVYSFGLYEGLSLIGIVTFGIPAISTWESSFEIIELNRLVVNDGLEKNVLSYFVSSSIKIINKECLIVSFADPNNGHNGYIYQATNFIYTGIGGKTINWVMDKKEFHNRHINKSDDYFRDILKRKSVVLDNNKTIKELWILAGGEYFEQEGKHRYFYIKSKNKKLMLNWLKEKYEFLPYPKGNNKRYDTTYSPQIQETMFL